MTPARLHHVVLLLPGASLHALGALTEALLAANETLGDDVHTLTTCTLDGRAITAAGGTTIEPMQRWSEAATPDVLHLIAERPLHEPPSLLADLRTHASRPITFCAIGSAALILADAGLLDGHRATLNAAHAAMLAADHPQVIVSHHLYEIDRARLSCASGSAVLDMLLAWLGQRHGDKLVQSLLAHFALERLRAPEERPRAPVAAGLGSSRLAEAVSLMEANLAEPLPTEDIARLVGVSRRQLERLFKQHLDELPSRYYAELRLARARRLLQQSNQSILQVGLACGFTSGSHFSNAYRARFGHTPRDARSQRALAWRAKSTDTSETPSS